MDYLRTQLVIQQYSTPAYYIVINRWHLVT